MKRSIILAVFSLFCTFIFAQNGPVIQRGGKGLHVLHTVAPKENFYSVGRIYNVPAKEIAAFNGLDMARGLVIGKTINIPLSNSNFTRDKITAQPVYYVVGQKEGLFRVSANNNNVLMAKLRKWNNLSADKITPGQKLIVGYLLAGDAATAPPVANNTTPEKKEKPEVKQEVKEKPKEIAEKPKEVAEKKVETAEVKKPEAPVEEKPAPKQEAVKTVSNPAPSTNDAGGFFKTQYLLQTRTHAESFDQTLTAGIFKTSSGWQDAKYYALMDNVEPGTIIKIVNTNNNKVIYAKVLDKMTGIRQNQGFELRMSNAAATALEITETDKFFVKVVY